MMIFGNGLYAGIALSPKQLLYQFLILVFYVCCDRRIIIKAIHAFLKFVMFLNVYWILGLLTGLDFTDMVQFSLRMVFLLLLSVYLIGSTNAVNLVNDSRFLLKHKVFSNIYFYLITTVYFIKGYQHIFKTTGNTFKKYDLETILHRWFSAMKENLAQAGDIGEKVTTLIQSSQEQRIFMTGANTLAVIFIALSMIVYNF